MNKITSNIFTAFLLIVFQTIIFNNINLFGYLNPFIYIVFIIYYPIKNDRIFAFVYNLNLDKIKIFQNNPQLRKLNNFLKFDLLD